MAAMTRLLLEKREKVLALVKGVPVSDDVRYHSPRTGQGSCLPGTQVASSKVLCKLKIAVFGMYGNGDILPFLCNPTWLVKQPAKGAERNVFRGSPEAASKACFSFARFYHLVLIGARKRPPAPPQLIDQTSDSGRVGTHRGKFTGTPLSIFN
ncbi:hypothetical protein N7528_003480 [Penicillium herquei]|nr:hypothetical protein N7528_003480 [Penicillium herquei]